MAEFPALPLWTDSFLADTTHLSRDEIGAYMLLLMAAWRRPQCDLPNDDKYLARIARCTPDEWDLLRPTLMQFFTVSENPLGYSGLSQKRLTAERAKVQARSERAKTNGQNGGRPKINDLAKPSGFSEETQTVTQKKAPHIHIHSKEDTSLRDGEVSPAQQISLPVEKAPDAALFDEGRKVLGKSAGGVVTNLRRHFGDDDKVLDVLYMAATKSNPAEWVGAILRKPASEVTVIKRPIPKKDGAKVWGYMVKGKPCNPAFADIPSYKLDMDDPAQKREAFVRANDLDLL